jgi:hypothetical protein
MSLMVEGVVDGGMDVEKPLRGSRRLQQLHPALPSPHDLMGVFSVSTPERKCISGPE